jgi:hypothetical protein
LIGIIAPRFAVRAFFGFAFAEGVGALAFVGARPSFEFFRATTANTVLTFLRPELLALGRAGALGFILVCVPDFLARFD